MLTRKQVLTAGLAALGTLPAGSGAAAQGIGCTPPVAPFVPSGDADLKRYQAIIASDYEQYFADLTEFFTCLQDWHQSVFEEAQGVTEEYENFLERSGTLGRSDGQRGTISGTGSELSPDTTPQAGD